MNITIRMIGADKEAAHFSAVVADTRGRAEEYIVSVGQHFWRAVSRGRFSPAELVVRSLHFMSKQPEAKKRIRDRFFDLSDLAAVFPNFASKIRTA